MSVYANVKIKEYADELPIELRRAVDALNDDIRLAIFFVLFKYGELSFSQIIKELDIPQEYSSKLTYHLKKLQKGALIKNEYVKKENTGIYSFYGITEFGEELLMSLINTITMPQSIPKIKSTDTPMSKETAGDLELGYTNPTKVDATC